MKIRMTRNAIVDDQPVTVGEIVETDDKTAVYLLNIGKAMPCRTEMETAAVTAAGVLMPDGGTLTLIKGISHERAEALAAMGIESVADLVDADAQAVANHLKGVSVKMATGWIADAIGMLS